MSTTNINLNLLSMLKSYFNRSYTENKSVIMIGYNCRPVFYTKKVL